MLAALEERDGHITSTELLERVNELDASIGRASVFRTLDLFTQLNLIRPTYIDSSVTPTYVLMPDGHHHHIICTNCNRVIEFEELRARTAAQELERTPARPPDRASARILRHVRRLRFLMHVVYNGWFWDQPNTGSGQYLRHLLHASAPRRARSADDAGAAAGTRRTGRSAADWSASIPTSGSRSNLGKVWFEQRTFPQIAGRVGADIAHVPYWGSPLSSPIPLVTSVLDVIPLALPEYSRRVSRPALHLAGERRRARIDARHHHQRRGESRHREVSRPARRRASRRPISPPTKPITRASARSATPPCARNTICRIVRALSRRLRPAQAGQRRAAGVHLRRPAARATKSRW